MPIRFSVLLSRCCRVALFLSFLMSRALAGLSPDAQAALDQGLSAAKLQQWTVAIRFFQQARAAAPDAPEPLFNLGLAESQIKGRELRAICWFEAYLALVPDAANAADVSKQIADLEIQVEGHADQVIEMLKAISDKDGSDFAYIAGLLAESGDMDGAEEVANDPKNSSTYKSEGPTQIAEGLIRAGKLKEAAAQIDKIEGDFDKDMEKQDLAKAEMDLNKFSDAAGLINQISHDEYKWRNWVKLARAENGGGHPDDALAILRDMRAAMSKHENDPWAHEYLASTEFELGQTDDVEAELGRARQLVMAEKRSDRIWGLCDLALALNDAGRNGEALSLMAQARKLADEAESANEFVVIGVFREYYYDQWCPIFE